MYFISPEIFVKNDGESMGIYARNTIPANTMIELSPVSNTWRTTWDTTPHYLKKLVFSFPAQSNSYAIALGYVSIYNHHENNNAYWFSCDIGVGIVTNREILQGEEICINYGENYAKNGWSKL